jgi:ElaB/YqjD/DUF883 family membrane-anchored ribosome-binding protein
MSQAKEQLIADLKVLAADAEELVKVTASQTGERIAAARARIQESVADLKPKLAQAQVAVVENARAAATVTDSAVRENPWAAMGIAAAAGLALGLLIGRR